MSGVVSVQRRLGVLAGCGSVIHGGMHNARVVGALTASVCVAPVIVRSLGLLTTGRTSVSKRTAVVLSSPGAPARCSPSLVLTSKSTSRIWTAATAVAMKASVYVKEICARKVVNVRLRMAPYCLQSPEACSLDTSSELPCLHSPSLWRLELTVLLKLTRGNETHRSFSSRTCGGSGDVASNGRSLST